MRGKKEGPAARTAKRGPKFSTDVSYHTAAALSTAAEMIMLAAQVPESENGLRRACFGRLERVLKRHYAHPQPPHTAKHRTEGQV